MILALIILIKYKENKFSFIKIHAQLIITEIKLYSEDVSMTELNKCICYELKCHLSDIKAHHTLK